MGEPKFTEVATNAIWRETVKRETRESKLRTNFTIPNPLKVPIVPEKPNRITPQTFADAEELRLAPLRLQALTTLKDVDKLPTQRYDMPQTSNQEIGWYHKPMAKSAQGRELFTHPRGSCDVTAYASEYYAMTGTTPYSRPPGGGKDGK